MKITDAVWEKRNLGVSCTEFTAEKGDTPETVTAALKNAEQQYNVLKIPSSEHGLLFATSGLGYTFAETLMNVTHDLKEPPMSSIQKRILDSTGYTAMNNDDIDNMYTEIRKNIFTTDRIAIDPKFSVAKAAERYVGWIGDEIQRGTEAFNLINRGNRIGFFMFKQIDDGIYFPFLAGIYADYMKLGGAGLNIIYQPIKEAVSRNGKGISTYISSNNKGAVNVHQMLNFKINEFYYVFIKHN